MFPYRTTGQISRRDKMLIEDNMAARASPEPAAVSSENGPVAMSCPKPDDARVESGSGEYAEMPAAVSRRI